jgi:hypothetical protein
MDFPDCDAILFKVAHMFCTPSAARLARLSFASVSPASGRYMECSKEHQTTHTGIGISDRTSFHRGPSMDRQEKHRQQKEKERGQENKADQAYEVQQQKRRLPVNSVWMVVVGVLLTALALYMWTMGMARLW